MLLDGLNPKNLLQTIGAAAGLAQLGLSSTDAVVSLIVFVIVASLTIAGPVVYYLLGGENAKAVLDELKGWLTRAQRRRDDGAVPRLGRRLDRKGPRTTDGVNIRARGQGESPQARGLTSTGATAAR